MTRFCFFVSFFMNRIDAHEAAAAVPRAAASAVGRTVAVPLEPGSDRQERDAGQIDVDASSVSLVRIGARLTRRLLPPIEAPTGERTLESSRGILKETSGAAVKVIDVGDSFFLCRARFMDAPLSALAGHMKNGASILCAGVHFPAHSSPCPLDFVTLRSSCLC